MGLSPFHGIFSSLSSNPPGKSGGSWREEAEETPPAAKKSTRPAGPQIGRVAVDIYEVDDYYIIKAPIAGVRLNDLDIEVTDNVLTIRGFRRQTDEVAASQYYLQECFWGEFSRSVTLPMTIDPRKVKASFNKEGILKILVPKEEKVKIVRISEG